MNTYTKPKLYETGYLLDDKNLRLKQGLMPQNLASVCFNTVPNVCKNCNKVLSTTAFSIAQKSTSQRVTPPVLNRNLMYPIHNDPVTYGPANFKDDDVCLRNIFKY
jgi:hypothetical protein